MIDQRLLGYAYLSFLVCLPARSLPVTLDFFSQGFTILPYPLRVYRNFNGVYFCFLGCSHILIFNEKLFNVVDDVCCFSQECFCIISCIYLCPESLTRPTRLPRHAIGASAHSRNQCIPKIIFNLKLSVMLGICSLPIHYINYFLNCKRSSMYTPATV